MNWFVAAGIAALGLGVGGLWLSQKLATKEHLSTRSLVAAGSCAMLMTIGFVQTMLAITEGRQHPEGVAGVVTKVEVNTDGVTTLTVQVGEDRQTTYRIDCLPDQKGCQSARPGDLVQYDRTSHPSGWTSHREVRFITPGANSK